MTPLEDNREKYKELKEKYPVFRYKNFGYRLSEDSTIIILSFEFECGEHIFKPEIEFFANKFFVEPEMEPDDLSLIAFNIGMIELISYWKAFASPVLMVETGFLSEKQIAFWKKLYFNGLGEYFYLNSIDTNIEDFITIVSTGMEYKRLKFTQEIDQNKVIVPIGGGKDSVVTLELLRNSSMEILPLIINPRGATLNSIEKGGFSQKSYIKIRRTIDKHLLELNDKGYLNGHTPFSAMLAFVSLFSSLMTNTPNIALSNENSANESTVKGEDINHQYSKSLEFEEDFRSYVREFISEDYNYFSFLRPMSELQIAQQFSLLTQYHKVFRSCNAGSKTDIWCLDCPKCLFAFIILSPFLSPNKLREYFGENLLNKKSIINYFDELIGKAELKPFECVGTIEEVNLALALLVERYPEAKGSFLINYWLGLDLSKQYLSMDKAKYLYEFSNQHFLNQRFSSILSNPFAMYNRAELSRTLIDKEILIYGFGKEGQSTYRLLRSLFPNKKLAIEDNSDTIRENPILADDIQNNKIDFYLGRDSKYSKEKADKYDIIIKSPGISLLKLNQPYKEDAISSQTNLFLERYSKQIIGITGTKGKSTTSTLVYNILKAKHKDVLLAGNIGIAMFSLIDLIKEDTIIILELSAHQLEYIKKAPKISILLNLFEEHLDHFQTNKRYQDAKLNILRYQKEEDSLFIYNVNDNQIKEKLKEIDSNSRLIPIDIKDYSFQEPTLLKGEHNKFNIMVAYTIAKELGLETDKGLKSILEFSGLEHRLQFVCSKDHIEYYNDSISTIPQATIAALESLPNVQTLILGGKDRAIDYSILENILFDFPNLKHIAYVGEAGRRMSTIIKTNPSKESLFLFTDNYNEIVNWCKTHTQKGSKVLLSPAAASYDMFKNFEQRGQVFMDLVKND